MYVWETESARGNKTPFHRLLLNTLNMYSNVLFEKIFDISLTILMVSTKSKTQFDSIPRFANVKLSTDSL